MNPEDRILVGVIQRKRDLDYLLSERWYRIPEKKAQKGIYADWLAFFLSGKVFKEKNGTIAYFAQRLGVELVQRRMLLPHEPNHKHADHLYHKMQLDLIQEKIPPIVNQPQPHRFAFIYTTGDRFLAATHIRDLYSKADYFVDRVFHVLKQRGYHPIHSWDESQEFTYPLPTAQLRILCEEGEVVSSPLVSDNTEVLYMRPSDYLEDVNLEAQRIIEAVEKRGGPRMVDIPFDFL